MYSINSIKGLKQRSKPSAGAYWGSIFLSIAVGIACFFQGEDASVIGIVLLGVAFAIYQVYKVSCSKYEVYSTEQTKVNMSIREITNNSIECFKNISRNQLEAQKALDDAEVNFRAGAYSPFWDAVEKATSELGLFSENLAELSSNLKAYLQWVPLYHRTPPEFPVTSEELEKLHKIGAENALAKRLSAIVSNAQRDYQFASIFEQRKAQKILVAGFENFADAMNNVGSQISNQIEYFESTMYTYNLEMSDQRERHHEELMETLNKDSNR